MHFEGAFVAKLSLRLALPHKTFKAMVMREHTMIFERIYDKGLAQASYAIGCSQTQEAIVIDPRRDIWVYLDWAREHNMTIRAVAETHIHADFLSGARELAQALQARLYISGETPEEWSYRNLGRIESHFLHDQEQFSVGSLNFRAIHTPGHTPEHMSYLLYRDSAPYAMFTGDFLFVGDVGRPDLLSLTDQPTITNEEASNMLFASLQKLVQQQPPHLLLWPGHGAGSSCGKSMDDLPVSTLGFEATQSWWASYLTEENKESFVAKLLDDQPEAPTYFPRMKQLNRDGMTLYGEEKQAPRLTPTQFLQINRLEQPVILDTRSWKDFASSHIQGALSLPAISKASSFAGWILRPDRPILLLANEQDAKNMTTQLARIGIEDIQGYIEPNELPISMDVELPNISLKEAKQRHANNEATWIDVRSKEEFEEGHVEGAIHLHYGTIAEQSKMIPSTQPLVLYCASGTRATIAASQLQRAGFTDVSVMGAGYPSWYKSGAPVENS